MTIPSGPNALYSGVNTHAGTPLSVSMGAFYEFQVSCMGPRAEDTGFIFSIYDIDKAVRTEFPEPLSIALAVGENPVSVLPRLYELLSDAIGRSPDHLRWTLNPFHHLEIGAHDMNTVIMTRHYTFSSSHRLVCSDRDAAGNFELFGKCSLPNGHGHNYTLVVHVRIPTDPSIGPDVLDVDAIVMEHVVNLFDHQNLNLDIEYFKDLNPTLENITVRCHELLEPAFSGTGASLERVDVWETERTSCSCRTPSPASGSS